MPDGREDIRLWREVEEEGEYPGDVARRREKEREGKFWEWARRTYNPRDVAALEGIEDIRGSVYWKHYASKIAGTQWDVPYEEPLPLGRPEAEKYGLTDADWKTLMIKASRPGDVQSELQGMLDRGYITQYQARDIWDELDIRTRQATLEALYPTPREKPKRGIPWSERQRMRTAVRPIQTRYGPAFAEERARFEEEVPQTERARQWFGAKFPSLIAQFEQLYPEPRGLYTARRGTAIEREREKSWREFLKREDPKERWYKMTPYERGERPSVYAPRIQTVGF